MGENMTYELHAGKVTIELDGTNWFSTRLALFESDDWVEARLNDKQLKRLTQALIGWCAIRGISLDDAKPEGVDHG